MDREMGNLRGGLQLWGNSPKGRASMELKRGIEVSSWIEEGVLERLHLEEFLLGGRFVHSKERLSGTNRIRKVSSIRTIEKILLHVLQGDFLRRQVLGVLLGHTGGGGP